MKTDDDAGGGGKWIFLDDVVCERPLSGKATHNGRD